jgi:hypothetical protein
MCKFTKKEYLPHVVIFYELLAFFYPLAFTFDIDNGTIDL